MILEFSSPNRSGYLKAEDVQNGDGVAVPVLAPAHHVLVHSLDEPAEEAGVEGLGDGVPGVQRLVNVKGREDLFAARLRDLVRELLPQALLIEGQQVRDPLYLALAPDLHRVIVVLALDC